MQIVAWGGFLLLIAFFLALDLGVFHKDDSVVSGKSALRWTVIWFVVSMAFNVVVYFAYNNHWLNLGAAGGDTTTGRDAAIKFFTGYILEQSLSIDNIFVISLLFRFFKVPLQFQHRVLFWGILGAIVLRVTMILAGSALVKSFSFTLYIFGAILIYTSIKMALSKGDDDFDPDDSRVVKIARKIMPISKEMEGNKFFTRLDGKRAMTPLFLVLLVVEGTDVVFAVDSIPAIFTVTTDAFLVFTSNIFAIMGLRSLFFALQSLLKQFVYLKYSIIAVLFFVGVKMLVGGTPLEIGGVHVGGYWHPESWMSLAVIGGLLGAGVLASLFLRKEDDEQENGAS